VTEPLAGWQGDLRMGAQFRFDRTWTFPVPPARLWDVLERTDDYVRWWSWLRALDGDGLRTGGRARFTIQAPLPYRLRGELHVLEAVAPRHVVTEVAGDLRGPARLDLAPAVGGCTARLRWSVELGDPVLARMARVARPVMVRAHDVVVAVGVQQFRRRALASGPGAG
jgi:uncharacterized protein YndB with AHSA1/START domain